MLVDHGRSGCQMAHAVHDLPDGGPCTGEVGPTRVSEVVEAEVPGELVGDPVS